MRPSQKETKILIKDYYYVINKRIPKIKQELLDKEKEIDDIISALTLSANKISDEVHGSGISKPVERIYEEKERLCELFRSSLEDLRTELEQCMRKERIYKKWFADSKLNEKEENVIRYTYSDGLIDWKIASKIGYESRTVRRIRKKALEKLSTNVLIDMVS